MKRKRILILVSVIFVILAFLMIRHHRRGSNFPHFVPGAPASLSQFRQIDYDWLGDAPFENDRLWYWARTPAGPRLYLYDLTNRVILGELVNAGIPGVCTRDGSRLLITQWDATPSVGDQLSTILRRLFNIRLAGTGNRKETVWVVDISRNVSTQVGRFSQFKGSGSYWHPSPDFRRGYNMPTASSSLFICDLDNVWLIECKVNGYPMGWWDDRHILIEAPQDEFQLFDVQTQTSSTLFTTNNFQKILTHAGITNPPDVSVFANWNGTNYDFYFGARGKIRGLHGSSYLLKANRAGPSLDLVSTNFGFRWGGRFDASGSLFLFQGESGTPGRSGNGAVFVRNLADGKESMIVPPDNKGQYAIPRFYKDEIIYFRDRTLHRVDLRGSNDSVIFPEGGK